MWLRVTEWGRDPGIALKGLIMGGEARGNCVMVWACWKTSASWNQKGVKIRNRWYKHCDQCVCNELISARDK